MNSSDLDTRINNFLARKYTEHPDIADSGRHQSRTVKYAQSLRASGQIMLS